MLELFAIGLVLTLVSGIASVALSNGQQEQQYELNSQLMKDQAGLNREQYDYEYAKESPAARVRQYMEAGLNPALMYSNGVAGMQGSVSGVSGSSVGIPNLSNLFDVSEKLTNLSSAREKEGETAPSKVKMEELKSVIALNDANKNIAEAMPDKIKAETDATRFDTHIKKALESVTIDTAKKNFDIATESYKSLQEQVKQLKEQNKVLPDKLQNDLKAQTTALALADWDLYYKQTYGDAEAKKHLTQLDALAQELFSRVDVNKNMATQLEELANKYKTDNEYQSYVNDVLKNRGFDVSNGGVYGLIERAATFFGRLIDGDVFK